MKIKVNRAFYFGGEPQPVGAVLEVERPLAIELIALGKASEAVESDEGETPKAKRVKKGGDDVAV
jgi:hypothetical protein